MTITPFSVLLADAVMVMVSLVLFGVVSVRPFSSLRSVIVTVPVGLIGALGLTIVAAGMWAVTRGKLRESEAAA